MDAGRELDRRIAKALRYWVYHYDKDFKANQYYTLMEPDSVTPVVSWPPGEGDRKTEDEAWEDAPHWSTDLSVAQELMERHGLALVPQSDGTGFRWLCCDLERVHYRADGILLAPKDDTERIADTPAHAIALTVLALLERPK